MTDRYAIAGPWATESVHRQGPYEFVQTGDLALEDVAFGEMIDVGSAATVGSAESVEPVPSWFTQPSPE